MEGRKEIVVAIEKIFINHQTKNHITSSEPSRLFFCLC